MPITQVELSWAIDAFALNTDRYVKSRSYYNGLHDLSFATTKFRNAFGTLFRELSYNRCAPVVDSMANRLKVTGFSVSPMQLDGGSPAILPSDDPNAIALAQQAKTLWRLGAMHLREGEIYAEAGTTGDAYAVVYFDAAPPLGTGLPRIWPNKADVMRVRYDDDGRITLAAKSWLVASGPDKNKRRITFYTTTEIIRLITVGTAEAELPKELAQYALYKEINALGQQVMNPIIHNLGRVPVVHYPNNAPMLGDFGVSELRDVMPLQDALNKSIADMLVAMEYNSFPQRYAIGIETPEVDDEGKRKLPWKAGPGEVWYSTEKDAKFGSFDAAGLEQFLKVQDQFDLDIARVSATPVHWLIMTGTPPSGESIKTADAPFTAKLRDRQRGFGAGHADAMSIKFQLLGNTEPLMIEPEWESAEPRSQREMAEIGQIMANAGIPLDIVARVMGLEDADIEAIRAQQEQEQLSQERAIAQLSGNVMGASLQAEQEQTPEA